MSRLGIPGQVQVRLAARLVLLLTLVCCLALPLPGLAALKLKGSVTLQDTMNPAPQQDDIVLPMPGNLSMVFRLVAVPVRGFLHPMPATLGILSVHSTRLLYDSSYSTTLSAPFTAKDLPSSWLQSIPEKERGRYTYYLMAKYEVSRLQYRAVMEDDFQADELKAEDSWPVTDISWYEAVRFTARYTDWLLANVPGALPKFSQDTVNCGYLRLPTEAEWEYAALGGHKCVTPKQQKDFFDMDGQHRYADYAVYHVEGSSHSAGTLLPIGSRLPSPLGLHDTAGNAAEMTMDPFRFSLAGVLQGSAGGFVLKGGSFLSAQDEILPGRREEMAPFLRDGAQRSREIGFRPVISGINAPRGGRMETVRREYGAVPEEIGPADQTLLKDLDALIARTDKPEVRDNLTSLRAQLATNLALEQEARRSGILSKLQNCLMYLKSVGYYEYRLSVSRMVLKSREAMLKNKPEEAQKWQEAIDEQQRSIANFNLYISNVLNQYIASLEDVSRSYQKADVNAALKRLTDHYARDKSSDGTQMTALVRICASNYQQLLNGTHLKPGTVHKRLPQTAEAGK